MCHRSNVDPSRHTRPSLHHSDNRIQGQTSGTAVQVGTVRGNIHLPGPTPPPEPRQLPAPPATYIDQPLLMKELQTAVARAHTEGRNAVILITGPTGVGKSALATRFLHDHEQLGTDGHFFIDLQGFSPGPPTDPHEALQQLLHSLGVDPQSVPSELKARTAWWRSVTAKLRVVLLLDDAVSAAQARVLLPSGTGHTIVVTSRLHLMALRLDGATIVHVPPLTTEEGVELLRRSSGAQAINDADLTAMRNIARMCGGLPVALCTVAIAESSERWNSWTRTEKDLRDAQARLARLNSIGERIGVEVSLRGAFDLSYGSLRTAQARAYRRLAWHPGPEITTLVTSCVTGESLAECEEALRDLAQRHLLTEHSPGRYRFHDLLRLHAQEKAAAHETDEAKAEGVDRLVTAFGDLSVAADAALRPYMESRPSRASPAFASPAQATAWLDTEKDNLVGLIELAEQHDRPRDTVRLTEGLWSLFLHHGQALLWLRAGAIAVPAARELGDDTALGRLLNKRALVYSHLSRVEDAMADLEAAEAIWSGKQEWKRVAQTRQRRGILTFQNHRYHDAVGFLQEALEADEHTEGEHNKAITLFMLGRSYLATGSHEEALRCLEQALPLLEGDSYNQARVRIALGSVLVALSQPEQARCETEAALAEMLEHGSVSGQGKAWEVLGEISEYQSDVSAAGSAYETALELLAEGDPARLRVQRRLDELG